MPKLGAPTGAPAHGCLCQRAQPCRSGSGNKIQNPGAAVTRLACSIYDMRRHATPNNESIQKHAQYTEIHDAIFISSIYCAAGLRRRIRLKHRWGTLLTTTEVAKLWIVISVLFTVVIINKFARFTLPMLTRTKGHKSLSTALSN